MDKQHHPMDRRFANEVHQGTTPGHRQARIDSSLFGLNVRYQVWSDCQARSRISGAQAGFTIAEYLIRSAQPNKDVPRELWHCTENQLLL